MAEVNNSQDVLDSRDIIDRIAELESELEDAGVFTDLESESILADAGKADLTEEFEELQALKALAEEASGSPDWEYGDTLIRDSYFEEYAQELAEDIGAIGKDQNWPNYCIDWERAANDLKMDYFSVDFDGVDYWIRS